LPPVKSLPTRRVAPQRPRHPIQTLLELRKVRRARGPDSFPLPSPSGGESLCGDITTRVGTSWLVLGTRLWPVHDRGAGPAAAPQPRSGTSQILLALLSREVEQECSPRRKPWVNVRMEWRKPSGRASQWPGKIWEQPFQPEKMGEAAVEAPDLSPGKNAIVNPGLQTRRTLLPLLAPQGKSRAGTSTSG